MPELLRNLPRLALALVAFVAGVAAVGTWLREPVTAVATLLFDQFGALGLTAGFALTDVMPFLPHSVILLLGHAGGASATTIFGATSVGAFLGVAAAWTVGRFFGRVPWITARLERYGVAAFLQRYGVAAVAIASVTPMPDSLTIVGAGASGVPLSHALLGATIRVPKIALTLWAISAGWSAGG